MIIYWHQLNKVTSCRFSRNRRKNKTQKQKPKLDWWKSVVWPWTILSTFCLAAKDASAWGLRLRSSEAKGWTGIEQIKSLREEQSSYKLADCSAIGSEAYLHSPRASWEPVALNKGSESEVGPALSHELHPTVSHHCWRYPHLQAFPAATRSWIAD